MWADLSRHSQNARVQQEIGRSGWLIDHLWWLSHSYWLNSKLKNVRLLLRMFQRNSDDTAITIQINDCVCVQINTFRYIFAAKLYVERIRFREVSNFHDDSS